MEGSFGNPSKITKEIGGQFTLGKDRIVRTVVGAVCKAIWPFKTDVEVADICGCDPRNARRIISGELPIPSKLIVAINIELVRRFE